MRKEQLLACFIFYALFLFSLLWVTGRLLLLWSTGCRALGLSRCHAGVVAPRHVDLSSSAGIEPASPALEGKFITSGPPGKSLAGML